MCLSDFSRFVHGRFSAGFRTESDKNLASFKVIQILGHTLIRHFELDG